MCHVPHTTETYIDLTEKDDDAAGWVDQRPGSRNSVTPAFGDAESWERTGTSCMITSYPIESIHDVSTLIDVMMQERAAM